MTNEEFSNEFDILINSYSSLDTTSPLKFDEYEKSVFLTEAQEKIIRSVYSGSLTGDSFEKTEEARRLLCDLVKTHPTETESASTRTPVTPYSKLFNIPKDTWFITYETVNLKDENNCINNKEADVVPVTQDELHTILKNPFRGPNKNRVLRLDIDTNIVELISKYNIGKYTIRYIAKPSPIILVNLSDGLSINGEEKETECNIKNPTLCRMILEMAVSLAIKSKSGNAGKSV